jgi:hypothetical protein
MNAQRALLCSVLLISASAGCSSDLCPVPKNADPTEASAVALLKPVAENVGWDEEGNVRSLDIAGVAMTPAELAALRQFTELEELNLSGTQVSDAGLESLASLQKLTGLSLAGTPITSNGLTHLVALDSLKTLDIAHTRVDDTGVEHLAKLSRLSTLFLDKNQLSEDGRVRLRQAIPDCRIQFD